MRKGRAGSWWAARSSALLPCWLACPAQAADERVVETVLSVPGTPEAGRPVTLDATLLTTDPAVPRPAIVLAHGLGGTKTDSLPTARSLARDGYAVLVYTARGFGASGGLIHLDDPAYEGRDAVAMVDAAAARPEVERWGPIPCSASPGSATGERWRWRWPPSIRGSTRSCPRSRTRT